MKRTSSYSQRGRSSHATSINETVTMPCETCVPTTVIPGETCVPTTVRPGETCVPTTVIPGETCVPTTVRSGGSCVPITVRPGRSRLEACCTKQTEANPKTTLFGSNMEKMNSDLTREVKKMDLNAFEELIKPRVQVRDPPPVLESKIKGDPSKVNSARAELDIRKESFQTATNDLQSTEKYALYNPGKLPSDVPEPGQVPVTDRPHQWMTAKDLANASSINVIGVDKTKGESYNRDMYEPKQKEYAYTYNGDPLNLNKVRASSERRHNALKGNGSPSIITGTNPNNNNTYMSDYKRHFGYSTARCLTSEDKVIPKNIEHQFGTRVCRDIFSDQSTVETALDEQARDRKRSDRSVKNLDVVEESKNDVKKVSSYEALSNLLRLDHCPGYIPDNNTSLEKDVYTAEVYNRHIPGTDQWRYQRDELSTWAECNFIRQRMKKTWDEKFVKKPT